ncbi:proton-conducting transporter membrane subunit [Thalassoglobus sp. JC818]|uniref:proton-conducting transporter transmembrane domain-containing protein n=1 Tax=Thalassoglobus sp. JC818 TaxID=3232136 RepID=UPI003458498B
MEMLFTLLFAVICTQIGIALLHFRFKNAATKRLRNIVSSIALLEFLLACWLLSWYAINGQSATTWTFIEWSHGGGISFFYDGATSLMLLLVSFIGFVVCRFSIRYLDGEESEARYFRFLGFTIGSVSLLVVAGNLLLLFAAWVMTSFGLHQLLLHYPHRRAAQRAAWTKFAISRIGDVFLIAALVLVFRSFKTFDLASLFSSAETIVLTSSSGPMHTAIALLLVLGAVTKSAQFPFHTWLPETLETPTPVSALMHAGIVNAGGYLIIRLSPIVSLAPVALTILALFGAFTACFAAVVMMTQPSIKRVLAYSTIAQMGFMMLQCGLGAFSAAMLHILAHSLYKAHAFLSSGSVIDQANKRLRSVPTTHSMQRTTVSFIFAAVISVLSLLAIATVGGLHIEAKPGGVILAMILCLALTTWGWRMSSNGGRPASGIAITGVVGMCIAYFGFYLAVDAWLQPLAVSASYTNSSLLVLTLSALGFGLLFGLHVVVYQFSTPTWINSLRVHASNGFYIESVYRRVFAPLKNT